MRLHPTWLAHRHAAIFHACGPRRWPTRMCATNAPRTEPTAPTAKATRTTPARRARGAGEVGAQEREHHGEGHDRGPHRVVRGEVGGRMPTVAKNIAAPIARRGRRRTPRGTCVLPRASRRPRTSPKRPGRTSRGARRPRPRVGTDKDARGDGPREDARRPKFPSLGARGPERAHRGARRPKRAHRGARTRARRRRRRRRGRRRGPHYLGLRPGGSASPSAGTRFGTSAATHPMMSGPRREDVFFGGTSPKATPEGGITPRRPSTMAAACPSHRSGYVIALLCAACCFFDGAHPGTLSRVDRC